MYLSYFFVVFLKSSVADHKADTFSDVLFPAHSLTMKSQIHLQCPCLGLSSTLKKMYTKFNGYSDQEIFCHVYSAFYHFIIKFNVPNQIQSLRQGNVSSKLLCAHEVKKNTFIFNLQIQNIYGIPKAFQDKKDDIVNFLM